jgi:ribonuclease HI
MTKPTKHYVVWAGRVPGVFQTWDDCKTQVDGFSGARYRSYPTRREAELAYRTGPGPVARAARGPGVRVPAAPRDRHGVIENSLSVDAACSRNPGPVEYQCVRTDSGEPVFTRGPYEGGTNNAGEFLAIVDALRHCVAKGVTLPIYSDSRTALSWVKRKRCKSALLEPGGSETEIVRLLRDAESWLQGRRIANTLLKWETDKWGEIPADYGRK